MTDRDRESEAESAELIIERAHIPVQSRRISNPHPKLAAATWIVLALGIAAGACFYWFFWFRQFAREPHDCEFVGGVRVPVQISGLKLQRSSISFDAPRFTQIAHTPEDGVVDGLVYGGPTDKMSFMLFTKPFSAADTLDDYILSVMANCGLVDVKLSLPAEGALEYLKSLYSADGERAVGHVARSRDSAGKTGTHDSAGSKENSAIIGYAHGIVVNDRGWVLVTYCEAGNNDSVESSLAESLLEVRSFAKSEAPDTEKGAAGSPVP